jgi:glycosyltransferase involved in cell wall biosynthesis
MFEVEEELLPVDSLLDEGPIPREPSLDGTRELAALASRSGLRRVRAVAWRDLEDPEAGGSELHAHEVLRRLAAAGIEVELRTSSVAGRSPHVERDGYRVDRRHGRYAVFGQVAAELARLRREPGTGLIEIWNGMPFLTPIWAPRIPRVVVIHHVHAEMWRMVLPRHLALAGDNFERHLAPFAYRRTRIVTPSHSSGEEIVSMLGLRPEQVTVVPNGVDPCFTQKGPRSRHPVVVAVGRLVPVKRLHLLVDAVVRLRSRHPELELVVVGEGYERDALAALILQRGAESYVSLAGRLPTDELVALYRRAWVLASTSAREGWGMTITEAAACGTPAVATRIAGHTDTVLHGVTGFLAEPGEEFLRRLDSLLSDEVLRRRLGAAAAGRAARFSWDSTAAGVLAALAGEAGPSRDGRARRQRRGQGR